MCAYFFFDGEKIDNFARPESAQEVQDAIYKVLSLETLTVPRLTCRRQPVSCEVTKGIVSDELKDLLSEDNDLRQQEDLLTRQNELKESIATAERHIEEVINNCAIRSS